MIRLSSRRSCGVKPNRSRWIAPLKLLLVSALALASGCGEGSAPQAAMEVFAVDLVDEDAPTRVEPSEMPMAPWEREPAMQWSLEEELRIGSLDGEGPDVFGRVRNLIPTADGGVWVFDEQAVELRRFDADGRHVVSAGRAGQGPGEFSGNACARRGINGEIWVEGERLWHRFSAHGELIETFQTPSTLACGVRRWMPDGRYLVANLEFDRESGTSRSWMTVHEWTGEGFAVVDTLETPATPPPVTVRFESADRRSSSVRPIPFAHISDWRVVDGGFWIWQGRGHYSLRLVTFEGDTTRRISRPYVPVPIDGEERRAAIDGFSRPGWHAQQGFDESRVPRDYPPFSSISTGADGSLYLRRQVATDSSVIDVFSASDEYLGELSVPTGLYGMSLASIGADHIWGVHRDEFDVPYVVRARIVRPE